MKLYTYHMIHEAKRKETPVQQILQQTFDKMNHVPCISGGMIGGEERNGMRSGWLLLHLDRPYFLD
jgi:hypothetical protein